jgi:hypothetical protein
MNSIVGIWSTGEYSKVLKPEVLVRVSWGRVKASSSSSSSSSEGLKSKLMGWIRSCLVWFHSKRALSYSALALSSALSNVEFSI